MTQNQITGLIVLLIVALAVGQILWPDLIPIILIAFTIIGLLGAVCWGIFAAFGAFG